MASWALGPFFSPKDCSCLSLSLPHAPVPPPAPRPEPYLKGISCQTSLAVYCRALIVTSVPRLPVNPQPAQRQRAPSGTAAPPSLALSPKRASYQSSAKCQPWCTRTGHTSASTTIRPPIRPSPRGPSQRPTTRFQPANLPRSLVTYLRIAQPLPFAIAITPASSSLPS